MSKSSKGVVCWACGHPASIQWHHIKPQSVGGTNNEGNLVPLCVTCHDKVDRIPFGDWDISSAIGALNEASGDAKLAGLKFIALCYRETFQPCPAVKHD